MRDELRPWGEFFDTKHFGLPQFKDISRIVEANLAYFKANYAAIACIIVIAHALSNLFGLVLAGGFLLLLERKVSKIVQRRGALSSNENLWALLGGAFILWFTGVGGILVASFVPVASIVVLHAACRKVPENRMPEEFVV